MNRLVLLERWVGRVWSAFAGVWVQSESEGFHGMCACLSAVYDVYTTGVYPESLGIRTSDLTHPAPDTPTADTSYSCAS